MVHQQQCTHFANNPRQLHANAAKYLFRYFVAMQGEGIMLHPDLSKSFEVHVHCNFAGNWVKDDSSELFHTKSYHNIVNN